MHANTTYTVLHNLPVLPVPGTYADRNSVIRSTLCFLQARPPSIYRRSSCVRMEYHSTTNDVHRNNYTTCRTLYVRVPVRRLTERHDPYRTAPVGIRMSMMLYYRTVPYRYWYSKAELRWFIVLAVQHSSGYDDVKFRGKTNEQKPEQRYCQLLSILHPNSIPYMRWYR